MIVHRVFDQLLELIGSFIVAAFQYIELMTSVLKFLSGLRFSGFEALLAVDCLSGACPGVRHSCLVRDCSRVRLDLAGVPGLGYEPKNISLSSENSSKSLFSLSVLPIVSDSSEDELSSIFVNPSIMRSDLNGARPKHIESFLSEKSIVCSSACPVLSASF